MSNYYLLSNSFSRINKNEHVVVALYFDQVLQCQSCPQITIAGINLPGEAMLEITY